MPPQREDFAQFARGFLMGGADIIPGVSGGTVALVLGIYRRLVTAISHLDLHLLSLAAQRRWSDAVEYSDLRFLISLAVGILTGIVGLAKLMRYMLLEERMFTLAVFFGLILGSSWIVARMVKPKNSKQLAKSLFLAAAAAFFAYWLVGLEQVRFQDSLGYFFLSGSLAICAMILPGISGAYILWLLGMYAAVTALIENILHLQFSQRDLATLLVFVSGCAIGLICFSKLLRSLLAHFYRSTMAVLGGFMVGSLRGMWPFQTDLTPEIEKLKFKRYESYLPETWSSDVTICLLLALAAVTVLVLLERCGTPQEPNEGQVVVN